MVKDRKAIGPGIGLTAEIAVNTTIIEGEEITMIEITDPIIELGVGQEMVMEMVIEEMTGMTVDQIMEETISGRTMVRKGIEIEVKVRIVTGPDKGLEIIQERTQEIEINTIEGARAEVEIGDKGPGLFQGTETGKVDPEQNQGLDLVVMLAPIGTDLDATDAVNMIILLGNALTL